jgi:phosphonate transport system permease protein
MTITEGKPIPLSKNKKFYTWAGVILVVAAALVTGRVTSFNLIDALAAMPGIIGFIIHDFLPPNFSVLPNIIEPLLDTLAMAVVSTMIASCISLVLAFVCAAPTTPHPALRVVLRAFASALRNIPSLAWVMILIPAFGIGKFVGVLALTIGSLGSLIRFFTETIEEIDRDKLEAIRAAGGSYWQMLRSGVIPQCLPGFIAWILYNFELDIRASAIIGMVGGGGIGFFIQMSIKLFKYSDAAVGILVVVAVVLIIEWTSKKIREAVL